MKEVQKIKFDCNGNNAPAYSCDKPGDNSGVYVQSTDYDELLRERNELAAQVERLRNLAIESQDWNWISEKEVAEDHGINGLIAPEMQELWDAVRNETPAQSLEAVKREWLTKLTEHCRESSYLPDDRALHDVILVSDVLSFEP